MSLSAIARRSKPIKLNFITGRAIFIKKPNVLFVFSDQQRWDTVSCYGQPLGGAFQLTPHLDALAAEGVRFDHAYSAQPVCGPARACIQTGRWPTDIACYVNDRMLPPGQKCVADFFNEAGYETAYVGKWHLASQYSYPAGDPRVVDYGERAVPFQLRGGYRDYWVAADRLEGTSHGYGGVLFDAAMGERQFTNFRADALTDYALEYLDRKHEKPFFMFLSYLEPHHQNDRQHYEGPQGSKQKYADYPVPGDLEGLPGDWQQELPDYLGCCASLDDNVGRLVNRLKQNGLLENTLILYTSDHGSHFRTRNSEYKRSCHDASLHLPLIACGPGFGVGEVVEGFVSTIDMAPTLLWAAGIEQPPWMPGLPIQQVARQLPEAQRGEVFVQISESCIGRALRTKAWTYCVEAPDFCGQDAPSSDVYEERYLYHNTVDPHQRKNLVAEPGLAAVRQQLREKLLARIFAAECKMPQVVPLGQAAKICCEKDI